MANIIAVMRSERKIQPERVLCKGMRVGLKHRADDKRPYARRTVVHVDEKTQIISFNKAHHKDFQIGDLVTFEGFRGGSEWMT